MNGVFLILDLYQESLSGAFTSLPAIPINLMLKFLNTDRFRELPEVRAAWAEHGKHDTYLTLSELRQRFHMLLPGVKIRKHLLWRYSLVWKNMAGQPYIHGHTMRKPHETPSTSCFRGTNGLCLERST